MSRIPLQFARFVFVSALVAFAASFMGDVHPIGDSLAVFRVWLGLACMLMAVVLIGHRLRRSGLLILVTGALAIPILDHVQIVNQAGGGKYTLYQKNLLFKNDNHQALIDDFLAVQADFVTVQELWADTLPIWNALLESYPYQLKCYGIGGNSASILSKWPVVEGTKLCRDYLGYASMQVEVDGQRVWLVSLHLPWPWPFLQTRQVDKIIPLLEKLDGPVLAAGDFNMVPWSSTMRRIEGATGSQRAGPIITTLTIGPMRLAIDHILTPEGQGVVTRRPLLGSDHAGLLAQFDL